MKKKRREFGSKNTGTAVYSLAEIGRACGVSLQAIQCVEQRALRKIKKAIEDEAEREGLTVNEWLFGDSASNKEAELCLRRLFRHIER